MAYFLPDKRHDIDMQCLIKQNYTSTPSVQQSAIPGYNFTCWSSLATPHDSQPISYCVLIALDGWSWCKCKYFKHYGGACKHMQVVLIVLNNALCNERDAPPIIVPLSIDEACAIQQQHLSYVLLSLTSQSPHIISHPNPIQHAALPVNTALEGDEEVEFEFSALCKQSSITKDVLNEQWKACVFYDLKQTIPKLHQLGVLLQGTSITKVDAPDVTNFQSNSSRCLWMHNQ